MKTQAAVLFEIDKPLRVIELSTPRLQSGQILVDVAYSGVCHNQLLEIKGKRGPDRFLPHTLGHEGSGVIREVGSDVTKVKPGDHVVLSWIKGNGMDVPSTTYQSAHGQINSGAISTFMRHAVLSENRVVPLPSSISLKEAALLGCAVPTGAGIVFNQVQVRHRQSIAIFGVGGIGMSIILAAKISKADPIIAIDIVESKLDLAKNLGTTHSIDTCREDPFKKMKEIVGEKGLDYAVEAAGSKGAMETAFKSVKDRGGLCILAGNLSRGDTISLDPFDLIKGKRIVGTWGGESCLDQDIEKYALLLSIGKLDLKGLITHEFLLEEVNEALNALAGGKGFA